ncbi:uncharacterized protein LODBEIA_P48690 [Lodderomyces beijingensis]|uniref:Holocytochrome c-type synthase n=1 Tax=Lodderomyces beijingensis TaxID=1775926 RepID=A0ABP0ZR67_9ASCO
MSEGGSKCPVDHSPKQSWLSSIFWKTQPKPHPEVAPSQTCPVPHSPNMANEDQPEQPKCPVDHSARQAWLDKVSVHVISPEEAIETPQPPTTKSKSCDSSTIVNTTQDTTTSTVNLPTEREISSIPRTSTSQNWIYPSEKQFFEAMTRKNWQPATQDMKVIVPIHNLVNERAWKHILMWEKEHGAQVSLTSFRGDSQRMTPRAWFKSVVLGGDRPFDRHDWVVSRAGGGGEVEYVIDFYNGEGASVWLDVRPKLNSFEGVKLRLMRAFGGSSS